ncbi:MAG: VanZ family protein, partial [Limnohabitans sp.]
MSAQPRTTAWALSWLCVLVIVYASLYPFEDWRNQDIAPWFFVGAPWSAYNTWFDIYSNLLGYLPLGFWWCLAAMRSQWTRAWSWMFAVFSGCALSFVMECMQTYLPARVPSQLDWLLNTSGALLGAGLALVLEKHGWLYRWSHFRRQWLTTDASGSLVLLVLWPLALLYPVTVPFGLGHVSERLEKILYETFPSYADTVLATSESLTLTMTPALEMFCVMLGAWIPGLLVLSVCQRLSQRLTGVWLVMVIAVLANGLSATLTYGPERAWHWLSPQVWG